MFVSLGSQRGIKELRHAHLLVLGRVHQAVLVRAGLVRTVLVGALMERYMLEVILLERTEVDRALRVRA
jgi:hypothetical protein